MKMKEKRRVPTVRAQRGSAYRAVGLSQAKFAQARSRDAPTLPGSRPGATLGSQSLDTHLPLNPRQTEGEGCATLKSLRQGCVLKAVLQGPTRGEDTSHLPSPLAEHPSYCRARPSRTPENQSTCRVKSGKGLTEKGLGVHTGCTPSAEWGVRGSERELTPLLIRDQGVKPNPEHPSPGIEDPKPTQWKNPPWGGKQEPRSHASRAEASCPLWGPSIFPPVPGSSDPSLRGGGGALCFSNARLTRTPRAQSGSPSALPRVIPARPAQGGTAALPSRCLTESADGGGGMSERSPGWGGRGQAHRRAQRVIG